jgi:hypothetical protein
LHSRCSSVCSRVVIPLSRVYASMLRHARDINTVTKQDIPCSTRNHPCYTYHNPHSSPTEVFFPSLVEVVCPTVAFELGITLKSRTNQHDAKRIEAGVVVLRVSMRSGRTLLRCQVGRRSNQMIHVPLSKAGWRYK